MPTLPIFIIFISNKSGNGIQSTNYIVFVCTSFIEMPTDFLILVVALRNMLRAHMYTAQYKVTLIKCAYLQCGSSNRKLKQQIYEAFWFVWSLLVASFFCRSRELKILLFSLKVMLKHEKLCLLTDMASLPPFKQFVSGVPHVIEIAFETRIVACNLFRYIYLSRINVLTIASKRRQSWNPFYFSSAIKCHQMCCINNIAGV